MRHDKPPTTPFEIGDRVRVNCPGSHWHGEETTVMSGLVLGYLNGVKLSWAHLVDISVPASLLRAFAYAKPYGVGFPPHQLIPIGDDFERGSWDEIEKDVGWNPARRTEAA